MSEAPPQDSLHSQPVAPELDFRRLAPAAPGNPPTGEHPEDPADWSYTQNADDVRRLRQELEVSSGREQPRHSIGRDTLLAEGVYEGAYGGEAIVLDYEADRQPIDDTVAAVIARSTDPQTGQIDKQLILDAVFTTVSERMRYDSAEVDRIFEQGLGGKDGAKISLNAYIEMGVGECRHQALYAGLVLEKLRERGVVSGRASVDRNMVKQGPDGKYDGHAWVRYTNSAGEVYIIDVAQQKIDTLDEMVAARQRDPQHTWDYRRPEDLAAAQQAESPDTVKRGDTGFTPYDESTYKNADGIIDRLPWQK